MQESIDINNQTLSYLYIDTQDLLQQFANENQSIDWMGFDTEFVGEKRYYTLLCLVQVITENGIYIIDSMAIEDLDLFYEMVENPDIVKVTHAGENDYRLLNIKGKIIPQNLFDTQVAAAFIGYNYPISFRDLVKNEVNVYLGKGYTVSNWAKRPFNKKQIQYALNDIIFLQQLWSQLRKQLKDLGRYEWAIEEMQKYEIPTYYAVKPYKEALNSSIMKNLRPQNQVFLIRLYDWRKTLAERKDYSKEMVLASKYIGSIARSIGGGKNALVNHRRIPEHITRKYADAFIKMYEVPPTPEELEVLKSIPTYTSSPDAKETIVEMIQLLIKLKCEQEQMAYSLVMQGTEIKKMKADPNFFDEKLAQGWRVQFLGPDLIHWMRNRKDVEIEMKQSECIIRMKS